KTLAQEIREVILATASEYGGHLAPHLGVVELTLAIHYVFDTDQDRLVWDVGHQTYTHKLVTGRRDLFHTIRRKGGLSGYPKRQESPYDAFGTGHSSTSISAALGMAVARDRQNQKHKIIAVIGDGAMTAGMAFEGLAHAGHIGTDMLVILNDNKMAIAPNVGALSSYLSHLITAGVYNRAREDVGAFVKRMLGPNVTKAAYKLEHSVKGLITPGSLFQELGFRYIGPADGHDLETLVALLSNIKECRGPILFHCVTQKGKGYPYAEEDPMKYHGVKAFDIHTGQFRTTTADDKAVRVNSFSETFVKTLIDEAHKDSRIVAITAAMPTGTGLSEFEKVFPDRAFDVGICEQHAVTFAAGLAAEGQKPVCAIYSTFFQRCFDQFVHDVCVQKLPVVFALDRAGAGGEDSPTHQGTFDISFLRCIPRASILVPRDDLDLAAMLRWALKQQGPVILRYPSGRASTIGLPGKRDVSKGQVLRQGKDATIVAVGPVVGASLEAAEKLDAAGLSVGVADARWIKPLDADLLMALSDSPIITVEENTLQGGFGSAVLEFFEQRGRSREVLIRRLGFPDRFIEHATRDEQLEEIGLTPESICQSVSTFLKQHVPEQVK
ncbi:MAG: 1-deoxy-D-xylulose-5-phosphate synthase, partial [Candidatus Hydrogenedentes bacterium]|nr:1-deoxy-D-xylulose-5-phosphate synthase [Candidatus Hydrogenedentota bacterium]